MKDRARVEYACGNHLRVVDCMGVFACGLGQGPACVREGEAAGDRK